MAFDQNKIQRHQFDAVIIGGGGAGLRASLQLAQADVKVCLLYTSRCV